MPADKFTDVPVDEQKKVLYANTDGDKLCDKLSSHLIRVAAQAVNIAHQLPLFASEMDVADTVRFTLAKAPYQWQDKAVRKIQSTKQDGMEQAWFILNMASTGCGKTTANAKLMQALSPDGKTCDSSARPPRNHEGRPSHEQLHISCIVPENHEGAQRGCHQGSN